ncbi:MAG: cation-translocating P-type ATPase [Gemmatimonadaceae bacterium]
MPNSASYRQSIEDVATSLASDVVRGLTASEAQKRRHALGPNELTAKPSVPWWLQLLSQFNDVLVILLLIAAAISTALWILERDALLPYDAIAIFAVVLLNAAMGYTQQSRAASAIAALRAMAVPRANVIRDGKRQAVAGTELVPGDVILIEEGDAIPADARLAESVSLQTAESALTGESLPVLKDMATIVADVNIGDRLNMVFSGTIATSGRGRAIVTATGMQTEMGRIADLLNAAPEDATPLQIELDRVGKVLGIIVVAIAITMIVTIIVVEHVRGWPALFEVLIFGVALAVAAVPEGLPALVTTVLALGVQRMARRNAIVRHLAAVEALGSASVIASDKTGTLTRNEMTVRAVVTASGRIDFGGIGYAPVGDVVVAGGAMLSGDIRDELVRALIVARSVNNAELREQDGIWSVLGDPTEGALIVAARKAGLVHDTLEARFQRVGEVPFSAERRMMTTVHTDSERQEHLRVFTKGAPGALVARCTQESVGSGKRPLTNQRRTEILKLSEVLAGEALRTLAVAARELPANALDHEAIAAELENDLVFLGLIGMIDPPREESKPAVARAKHAGIRPIMITGDHPKTALVIATELGIAHDERVLIGAVLEQQTDAMLAETVCEVSVYARVSPEQKLRIIKALQHGGAIVAMTGDGVNDAPALKTADIGIAMGITGTDVSRQAADVVLTDDNYATIIVAVEEGRAIFANIRKFLRYLLSSNLGEVMTMFFGVLFAHGLGLRVDASAVTLPLLATQILWINLITDGAPALALGVDPAEAGLMNIAPRPRSERVITRPMWFGIAFVGAIMAAGTLFALDASLPGGLIEGAGSLRYAQTRAFTTLVFFQLINVFNARSDEHSAFQGLFVNRWLWASIILSLVLQAAVIYVPFLQNAFSTVSLSGTDWLFCAAVASSVLWLREGSKFIARRRHSQPSVAAT